MDIKTDLEALSELERWPGQQVIDVGCGRGALARSLAEAGATVLGVEPDAAALAIARAAPRDRLTFHPGSAIALPCPDQSADVVIFNRSLHHIPIGQMDAALREARRALRPGGRLVVLEPDPDGQMSMVMEPFHNERVEREAALAALERLAQVMRLAEERWFARPYVHTDLETFRDRMRNVTHMHTDRGGLMSPLVAERFAQGTPVAGGVRFTNPIRVRVYTDGRRDQAAIAAE